MKITWLGHSAFRIEIADAVILIDPFLRSQPAFDGSFETMTAGCTHVVLTHGHDDHIGDTVEICKATGAQLISAFEVCMWLGGQGITNINPGNLGGTLNCGAFKLSFTQACHSSSTIVDGKIVYLGPAMGVVLEAPGEPSLYHAGDTCLFGDMALIHEIYQPKIGILPVGDRFTMNGPQAALACRKYFDFDMVIPCHFGTFPMLAPNADSFVEAMAGSKPAVKVLGYKESVTVGAAHHG